MMDPKDPPSIRPRARIGRVLRDKWRIDQLLGIGGMASVYAATHCNNGKRVAIKVLHPELSMVPELRSRFLREGYVANKVTHPSIVSILDDDVADDGSVFLVMELLDGETVEALRDRSGSSLPVSVVVQLIDQLLDVLAAAHDAGIVHRDIKPENLFLTRDGTLKVLDFGIARLRELQTTKITMTGGGTMGTPAFMPPEQARGRSELISQRTDLWAVGATMFTLASGRLVHDAETVNELLLAAMTRVAPPTLTLLPGFPSAIAAVIDRALAFEQSARWPDARSMQMALRQAAMSIGVVIQDRMAPSGLTPSASFGASAASSSGGTPPFLPVATAGTPVWGAASGPQPNSNAPGNGRGVPPSGRPPPMLAALPIKPTPPIMLTAPAVTMGAGANMLLPARGALQPKWILAISGLVLLLSGIGVWLSLSLSPSLKSKFDSATAQGEAPAASVTASAEAPPAETAVTVKPALPSAPSVPPALPSGDPVQASAAPSAPLPSSKPVAQPPTKNPGAPSKASANTPTPDPKKKNERALLDRRN